jgi:pimeloyl-ACP methyl ester carboxylesterase
MKRLINILALMLPLAIASGSLAAAPAAPAATAAPPGFEVSDDALVAALPGFKNHFAEVNGVRLHYVDGGKGQTILLLPGWPETWWAYHKVMPELASKYRVLAIDIRGMGTSAKPDDGYDKKTMAADVRALVTKLGLQKVHIVGHDIGANVAYSFAANYPEATRSLTMLDVPHPDEELAKWPLLPAHGTFNDKLDENHPYAWWFAFHQVRGLPEQLLEGRAHLEHNWFFHYLMKDESAIDAHDRAIYSSAYATKDAIRAGNAWYQAFSQDILDDKTYARLHMPVLGIAGPGYQWLKGNLTRKALNFQMMRLENSGHFIAEEAPREMNQHLLAFLARNR